MAELFEWPLLLLLLLLMVMAIVCLKQVAPELVNFCENFIGEHSLLRLTLLDIFFTLKLKIANILSRSFG